MIVGHDASTSPYQPPPSADTAWSSRPFRWWLVVIIFVFPGCMRTVMSSGPKPLSPFCERSLDHH